MSPLSCPRARLSVDLDALAHNYRTFATLADAARTGAAVKADCYGLGLDHTLDRLWREGCQDYFVATLAEAAAVRQRLPDATVHLLGGLLPGDVPALRALGVQPVLNAPEQVAQWRHDAGAGAPCDLMLDTGMNRLGLRPDQLAGLDLDGLTLDLALSHLACADEPDNPMSEVQRDAFARLARDLPVARRSLANSAGIARGTGFAFDLVRPGIGLYGGVVHPALADRLRPVAHVEAQVLQLKTIGTGDTVGYGATWRATRPSRIATIAIGYADGYLRGFSNRGAMVVAGTRCPVVGRVSMDLVTLDVTDAPACATGDWVSVLGGGISLDEASQWSGLTHYELLTTLGHRYDRRYLGQQ